MKMLYISAPQARNFWGLEALYKGKCIEFGPPLAPKILRFSMIQIRSSKILRFETEGGISSGFGARGGISTMNSPDIVKIIREY